MEFEIKQIDFIEKRMISISVIRFYIFCNRIGFIRSNRLQYVCIQQWTTG